LRVSRSDFPSEKGRFRSITMGELNYWQKAPKLLPNQALYQAEPQPELIVNWHANVARVPISPVLRHVASSSRFAFVARFCPDQLCACRSDPLVHTTQRKRPPRS
jgi:hypothetical protein